MRRFNEDALKRAKDKKEKDAEYNSYPNFKARVIKKAQDEDYLNNVYKKYKFEVEDELFMDIEDDYSSGTLEILVPEVSGDAGIDIFINAEKGRLSFLLAPFDYVNTEMEVPFGDDEEIFEGIFGFSSDEFYQEGDYDKLIKKLNELCGADVAKKAEEVLDNFFAENYDKISKIVGVNESKSRNEGIYTNDKEEENYQNFITGLERLSKKYGIGLSAVGCFDYWDENGFKSIKYKRDSSSGDLMIDELIFSDGERLGNESKSRRNELKDDTVLRVHNKRKADFDKAEKDFYIGVDNAEELRSLKKKLDDNTSLMDNRELRKNYNGRYLRVEYDDDQAIYDIYYDDQIEQGRTEEDILEEDAKAYTVWLYGANDEPIEELPNGKFVGYISLWAVPGWKGISDKEILKQAQEEWGTEVVPNNIRIVEWG